MDITAPDKLAEIRRLNDMFRTTFRDGQILHDLLPDLQKIHKQSRNQAAKRKIVRAGRELVLLGTSSFIK